MKLKKFEEFINEGRDYYKFTDADIEISTDDLTQRAGKAKTLDEFIEKVKGGLDSYSEKLSDDDIEYLTNFFTRHKKVNENTGLPKQDYEAIDQDLMDVLGLLSGAVSGAAIDQVFSAGEGINKHVRRLMLDLANRRNFNTDLVDQQFNKSGLSPAEFVKQVKKFTNQAL